MLSQLGYQIVSVSGAVLVLVGYMGLQRGWMRREDHSFNLLNLVGSALLAAGVLIQSSLLSEVREVAPRTAPS